METPNLADHTNVAAALLSAMANPKRLLILCSLVKGEVAVGVLATQVGLSQSALSQHLSKLRAQKLVKTRRDAQTIYYSVHPVGHEDPGDARRHLPCSEQKQIRSLMIALT
uniref:Negative transacting factor n=1 Tax=Rhizobium etli TaxID=29449 RepID=Q8RK00_RHIET|nr:negative transacting factor [Rhizobium etli]